MFSSCWNLLEHKTDSIDFFGSKVWQVLKFIMIDKLNDNIITKDMRDYVSANFSIEH